MKYRAPLAERFWARVKKRKSGCWEWTGGTTGGYGMIGVRKSEHPDQTKDRPQLAHRVAWFLYTGKWPTEKILHTCDNPPCVRQEHLYEGTQSQNMQDCVARGRWGRTRARGSKHGRVRLTIAKVRKIRTTNLPDRVWAERFEVALSTIRQARAGESWNWLTDPPPVRRKWQHV